MISKLDDEWDWSRSKEDLGYPCGMKGLCVIFATFVVDYNHCMEDQGNHKLMILQDRANLYQKLNKCISFDILHF